MENKTSTPRDPFAWLDLLPQQPDPLAFAAQIEKSLLVSQQVKRDQDEERRRLNAEAEAEAQAAAEPAEINRLVAIVLTHARSLGIDTNTLPPLKRKNYPALCEYIKTHWAELSPYI